MNPIKIEQFEGPLDLLLQLIESEKLPINEISLALVTEQYSRFVYASQSIPLEEVADYLVIVSKLLLIKSRTLIPTLAEVEEDGPTLADQLRLYQQFHEKTGVLAQLWESPLQSIPRPRPPVEWVAQFRPPQSLHSGDLGTLMRQVIAKLVPPKAIIRQLVDRAITLQQTIANITLRLTKEMSLRFSSMVGNQKNKTEVIMNFLALLELVKQRNIRVNQSDLFGDMIISSNTTV